ncbi:hypothetical protein FB639_005516 [Coemansia asiatica]|nr:hypothetical protein FB639_005516 [Coemansia asiatica]
MIDSMTDNSYYTADEDYIMNGDFDMELEIERIAKHSRCRDDDEESVIEDPETKCQCLKAMTVVAVGSMVSDSAQRPYAQLCIKDHTVKALLDSGASRSFVTMECVKRLGLVPHKCKMTTARTADGQETKIGMQVIIPVNCDHAIAEVKAYVFPLHDLDMIIGYDSWEAFNVQPGYAGEPWYWTVAGVTQAISMTLPPAPFLWSRQQLARAL